MIPSFMSSRLRNSVWRELSLMKKFCFFVYLFSLYFFVYSPSFPILGVDLFVLWLCPAGWEIVWKCLVWWRAFAFWFLFSLFIVHHLPFLGWDLQWPSFIFWGPALILLFPVLPNLVSLLCFLGIPTNGFLLDTFISIAIYKSALVISLLSMFIWSYSLHDNILGCTFLEGYVHL